jgi:hypothetical protein
MLLDTANQRSLVAIKAAEFLTPVDDGIGIEGRYRPWVDDFDADPLVVELVCGVEDIPQLYLRRDDGLVAPLALDFRLSYFVPSDRNCCHPSGERRSFL